MANDSYFQINDDIKMKRKYSHNHQKRNEKLKTHFRIYFKATNFVDNLICYSTSGNENLMNLRTNSG